MAIRQITKEAFYKLAPNIRELGHPDREVDWYASDEEDVIAKLVLDRIEKTWLGFIWVRDEEGAFGTGKMGYGANVLAGKPYEVKAEAHARELILTEMGKLLKTEKPRQPTLAETKPNTPETSKHMCSVCSKSIPPGSPFIRVVSQPADFTTFKSLQDVWEDKAGTSKRVEDSSRQVCESCMMGVLPRWIKNAGNAGLMIATNQIARTADPGELCPQCLEPATELIWGVLNDNSSLFDWFWWCTSCKGKWWYSPENLPNSRPAYRTAEQRKRDEENERKEKQRREDDRRREEARKAEERRKEDARKAEAARVHGVKAKRQAAGQCENCGSKLRFMDRLLKRSTHPACSTYRDSTERSRN